MLTIEQFFDAMNGIVARKNLSGMIIYVPLAIREIYQNGGTPTEAAKSMHMTWFWRNGGSGESPYWRD